MGFGANIMGDINAELLTGSLQLEPFPVLLHEHNISTALRVCVCFITNDGIFSYLYMPEYMYGRRVYKMVWKYKHFIYLYVMKWSLLTHQLQNIFEIEDTYCNMGNKNHPECANRRRPLFEERETVQARQAPLQNECNHWTSWSSHL